METLLEIRTLGLVTIITSVMLALGLLLAKRLDRDDKAVRLWAGGSMLWALAVILVTLRGVLPDFISIVFANALIGFEQSRYISREIFFIGGDFIRWKNRCPYRKLFVGIKVSDKLVLIADVVWDVVFVSFPRIWGHCCLIGVIHGIR